MIKRRFLDFKQANFPSTKTLAMLRLLLMTLGLCSIAVLSAQTLRMESEGFTEDGAIIRLYVDLPVGARVQSLYATETSPMSLLADEGFHQTDVSNGGGFLPGISPDSDSWLTIGTDVFSTSLFEIGGPSWEAATIAFEAGNDFQCDGEFGGSVYVLPGNLMGQDDGDGVLLGQFITSGDVAVTLNLQWKDEDGVSNNAEGLSATMTDVAMGGCTDPMALNYAAAAVYEDGSCVYQTSSFSGLDYELVDSSNAVYRVYATLQNPVEHVVSLYGTEDQPLSISSTAEFNQIGSTDVVGALSSLTDEALSYDSWVTIGGQDGLSINSIGLTTAQFAGGGALQSEPAFGGSWFLMPGSGQATPDSEGRVLLAQLSSVGAIDILCNLKYRNADDEPVDLLGLTLQIPALEPPCETDALGICDGTCEADANANGLCDADELAGCTDMSASNYLPGATLDDGSCDDSGTAEAIGFEGLSFTETTSNGQITYRIYGQFDGAGYEVVAQYGWDEHPYHMSTTGQFHQVASAGALASDLTGSAAESDDSWLTIGSDDPDALNLYEVGMNLESFEEGGDILLNDPIGGAVFNIPGEQPSALSGADGQVLLAQLTIDEGEDLDIQLSIRYLAPVGTVHDALDATLSLPLPILGCTDPAACNTDAGADTDDGSCTYAEPGLNCDGGCINDEDMDGICDEDEVAGCIDSDACNYNPDATDDDGSCLTEDCDGDGVCDAFEVEGCMYADACNYDPDATDDDGSCLFAESMHDCDGNCLFDPDGDGICNGTEDLGCTYPSAANYDEDASIDDGSCLFPTGACAMDFNQDGEVNVPDLLDFLVKLGDLCPLYLE